MSETTCPTDRFATPDPALAVGTIHQGFTVVATEPLSELSGTAYVMRHNATGARLLWLATADTNRSFAIAFKTPPADDTGVFHILEHSVLCGSDRFPVKEPFVDLLKSSMQTFLNALTFPDKTMYPVSSTNVADLENLMDVYLDAVLHPAIYNRPRIFEQEGWHYELTDDDQLVYNGVVFNEMKGALSDPDDVALMHLERALFPDTPYRFESGGHPRAIPTLTYERFIDHHARHYNLPNSYTILYGDIDIERELAFVGERFDAARPVAGEANPLPLQAPVTGPITQVKMATDPSNASVTLGYVLGTSADRERVLATDILLDVLAGSNEAPLKRAVLDSGLGDDFNVTILDGLLQPQVLFVLKGAKPGVANQFKQLVEDVCASLVKDKIPTDRTEAALAQAEFNLRENDWGGSYSDGVALSIQVMSSWLYDDDRPVDYLRYEHELASIGAGIGKGYFERLLDELVCSNKHQAGIELIAVEEGDSAEEQAELAQKRAGMSEADVQAIRDEVAALREEQERPDTPEDLAKLPRLTVADIGDAPAETSARWVSAPLPGLAHELDTHRIVYAYNYFDLRRLSFDELPYATLLSDLLGRLATERLSAAELDTVVERNLGNLSFFPEVYGKDGDPEYVRPMMVVGASSLSEKVSDLAALPAEVWSTTRFDDLDQIHDIVQQRRISMERQFLGAGHSSAIARLSSYYCNMSKVSEALSGVDYYLFVKDLLSRWDELAPELPAKLEALAKRIFTSDEMFVSITGSAEDRDAFWKEAGTLGLPALGSDACAHKLQVPTLQVKNEAFVIPSNVCYVAEGQPPLTIGTNDHGSWSIASRALSYDYLWNEVRVKGGAYGTGFRYTTNGLTQFWSYRDPGVDPTVARFEKAADWLSQWDPTESDFAGFVVSVVAKHDAPLKPRQLARRQDSLVINERPEGYRDMVRAQQLAVTPAAIRDLASDIEGLFDRRGFCVFGSRELVEASGLDLTVVDLLS